MTYFGIFGGNKLSRMTPFDIFRGVKLSRFGLKFAKSRNFVSRKFLPLKYINLLVLVLAILTKLVVILKLGLRSVSKMITSLIFLNIYTPPQHALIHIILFVSKQFIRLTLNSTLKLKKLYILTGKNLT